MYVCMYVYIFTYIHAYIQAIDFDEGTAEVQKTIEGHTAKIRRKEAAKRVSATLYSFLCVCVCLCVCVYIYIYIYIYI